jgi:hypothetical protein
MSELLRSKSRLSSPCGGNIYFNHTIVDELEVGAKSRKMSMKFADNSEASENSNSMMSKKSSYINKSPHLNMSSNQLNKKKVSCSLIQINEAANEESQKKEAEKKLKESQLKSGVWLETPNKKESVLS